jgi:hypothetical protein
MVVCPELKSLKGFLWSIFNPFKMHYQLQLPFMEGAFMMGFVD